MYVQKSSSTVALTYSYIAIPVLRFQVLTVISLHTRQKEENMGEGSIEYWEDDNVRTLLAEISSLAAPHISKVRTSQRRCGETCSLLM